MEYMQKKIQIKNNFSLYNLAFRRYTLDFNIAGYSAAWLARFVRDEEVEGSNPPTPI